VTREALVVFLLRYRPEKVDRADRMLEVR
jgi:hypothetical protein